MINTGNFKTLSKKELENIKGESQGRTWTPQEPQPCTGDVDGDPNTTWDRYCKDGETELK